MVGYGAGENTWAYYRSMPRKKKCDDSFILIDLDDRIGGGKAGGIKSLWPGWLLVSI